MKPNLAVTAKSTKEQILQAYQEALEKLKKKEALPKEIQKIDQEKSVVAKASVYSNDVIIKDLASLKTTVTKQIDSLSEDLLNQFEVLSTLKKAIDFEKQHLKEIYDIQENAHTLSALIQSQQEEKKKFEEQVVALRQTWKTDKENFEADFKETKERLDKERKRDEEEYKYKIGVERKKEEDVYTQKKKDQENELALQAEALKKREDAVLAKEEQYLALQEQVSQFESKKEAAILIAEKNLKTKLEQQFAFDIKLKVMETEGLTNLLKEKIETLQAKVLDQNKVIDALTERSASAVKQVQDIACKALESSSKWHMYQAPDVA